MNTTGKLLRFHREKTKHYGGLQDQLFSLIENGLRDLQQADLPPEKTPLSMSLFLGRPADVLLPHLLADRDYLLRRDKTGARIINGFKQVWVAGDWLRQRLLDSPDVTLEPHQVIAVGSPRVEMLQRLAMTRTADAHSEGKLKALWAPSHSGRKLGQHVQQRYSEMAEHMAQVANIAVTSVPHPILRKDKTPVDLALLDADMVISDNSSVVYEAWALGKPVIFPRWLLKDHILEKTPESAEAHIYRERIGYHPESLDELVDMLTRPLVVTDAVRNFIASYLVNATGQAGSIPEIKKILLDRHQIGGNAFAKSDEPQASPASTDIVTAPLPSSDDNAVPEDDTVDGHNETGKQAIHFCLNKTINYESVQLQIADFLAACLEDNGFPVTRGFQYMDDACTISMFIRDQGRIYIGHNLADKNYLMQLDETGEALINKFEHVFVPGAWLRKRLLQNPRCQLRADQIHLIGAPRVDYLRKLLHTQAQDANSEDSGPVRVLWAPTHDQGKVMSSYPAFATCLENPVVTDRRDITWTAIPHPRNRDDKQVLNDALLEADIVVSDYSSVVYEAWALGKPVIFPRWLLGDHILEKAPDCAEAHIYRARIGYHPDSLDELVALLHKGLPVGEDVHDFMRLYLHNYSHPACAEQVVALLEMTLDADYQAENTQLDALLEHAMIQRDWPCAKELLQRQSALYNARLPIPDTQRSAHAVSLILWAEYEAHSAKKQWPAAENVLREMLEYEQFSARTYDHLAQMLRKQGKSWQEIEALQSAVALDDRNATLFYRLGEALEVMQRYRQAARAYQHANERKSGQAEWLYRLGYAHESEGHDGSANLPAAQKAYARAIALDKNLEAKRFGIGVFHQHRGHWPQARDAYRKHLRDNSAYDAALFYKLGMAHDRCYEWDEAEIYYKCALALDVTQSSWHYRLGFVLERQNRLAEAAQAYQFAALKAARHTPYWFYRWGYVLHRLGRHEEAVKAYLQLQQQQTLDKPRPEIVQEPALTQDAPTSLDEPASPQVTEEPAPLALYLDALDRKHTLLGILERFLEQDPTNTQNWYQLGNEYERAENWEKASEAYGEAVSRQAEHTPSWYYRLGYALSKCGDMVRACETLRDTRIFHNAHGLDESKYLQQADARRSAIYTAFSESHKIEDSLILYESFHGASASCNPLAIFLRILDDPHFKHYKHVWVLNNVSKAPCYMRKYRNVIFVQRDSNIYLKYLSTAKYLINNNTFPPYFIRRDEQLYLNTWHGTPWKTLGKDMKSGFWEHKNVSRNLLHATHLISPNLHTTRILTEGHGISKIIKAKIYHIGYPRVDMTLRMQDGEKQQLRNTLKIANNQKVIFYAPTYRGSSIGTDQLDIEPLKDFLLAARNLPGWTVLFRGHHMTERFMSEVDLPVTVVPAHIDTNEILAITDLLVTDYSSVAFDAIALKIPVILYGYDYDQYREERGLFFDIEDIYGIFCDSVPKVMDAIRDIDLGIQDNRQESKIHAELFAVADHGASERAVNLFFHGVDQGRHEPENTHDSFNIISYSGAFVPNGITSSFTNLVRNIDNANVNVFIATDTGSVAGNADRQYQYSLVDDYVEALPRAGILNQTIEESWVHSILMRENNITSEEKWKIVETIYQREFRRLFGDAKFDALMNFEGYVRFWALLFAMQKSDNKIIYLHNDMWEEYTHRFPNQETVFNVYKRYDKLISVSRQTDRSNRESLANRYHISEDRFDYADNLIESERVLELSRHPLEFPEDQRLFESEGPVFLNMARLSVEKGQDQLIEAFARVQAQRRDARLLILGDGPCRTALNSQIRKLGLQDNIHVLGWRSNPFCYLKRADCFVFSSKYEGQGLVLLEAMILEVPVICTDFPCAHDVLNKGEHGLIVPNTADGLAGGMLEFLSNGLQPASFDYRAYQARALGMFYRNVCGIGAPS